MQRTTFNMPTFYANGITIQLSTARLEDVITRKPTTSNTPQSTLSIEKAGDALTRGSIDGTLAEDALLDETTNSHLRYLGENRDMPFFLARAGQGYFDIKGKARTRAPARVPPIKHSSSLQTPTDLVSAEKPDGQCKLESPLSSCFHG